MREIVACLSFFISLRTLRQSEPFNLVLYHDGANIYVRLLNTKQRHHTTSVAVFTLGIHMRISFGHAKERI